LTLGPFAVLSDDVSGRPVQLPVVLPCLIDLVRGYDPAEHPALVLQELQGLAGERVQPLGGRRGRRRGRRRVLRETRAVSLQARSGFRGKHALNASALLSNMDIAS
ncbi:hypothetical protein ANANG_G00051910, partial [Anguilla anguilla]